MCLRVDTVLVGVLVMAAMTVKMAQSDCDCSTYGGGSCCADVDPIDKNLEDSVDQQPFYYQFIPDTDVNRNIDNICATFFPLPDDPDTFLLYISQVYCDGFNHITSFIMSQPSLGVRKLGKGLCSYAETIFAHVDHTNVDPNCDVFLYYRCVLRGDCPYDLIENANVPVLGLSNICGPISMSCLNSIKSTINNNGLPDQDYYILPQKLPTRCVFNQVCTILPAIQRFRQAAGLAFPSLRY